MGEHCLLSLSPGVDFACTDLDMSIVFFILRLRATVCSLIIHELS